MADQYKPTRVGYCRSSQDFARTARGIISIIIIVCHLLPASEGRSIKDNQANSLLEEAHIDKPAVTEIQKDASPTTINTTLQSSDERPATTENSVTTFEANSSCCEESEGQDEEVGENQNQTNLSDREKLVSLQSSLQANVKDRIRGVSRKGMEMFERLSLSGGCSYSLMTLMSGIGGIKSYAFKFLDASAKIPSGMMNGLLSDFGDFDQCLSIHSNPGVSIENEYEENAFSGKYCLMSLKMNYHIDWDLKQNPSSAPEGIIPDGVIWDELVRNYWISNSTKGFQVGMCFPSRCTNDDLVQIFNEVSREYNIKGEITGCQDGLDLKKQYSPDLLQRIIIHCFSMIVIFTFLGTVIDRYLCSMAYFESLEHDESTSLTFSQQTLFLVAKTLLCFSLIRNWKIFMQTHNQHQFNGNPWNSMSSQIDMNSSNKLAAASGRSDQANDKAGDTADDLTSTSSSEETHRTDETMRASDENRTYCQLTIDTRSEEEPRVTCEQPRDLLGHLAGFRLFIIIWVTIGHSFLYPSANNYQYYRSIISMNVTRDSVWFATTNFTLGIDMLLYITGLVFVYKLAHMSPLRTANCGSPKLPTKSTSTSSSTSLHRDDCGVLLRMMAKKILLFWPTYLSVIALAIVVPLLSDGPMWPEMVSRRLGSACRQNWWTNLLMMNNYLNQSDVCLPSSWFISVVMQLFLIGSLVILLSRLYSMRAAIVASILLVITSMQFSFLYAYTNQIRAPVIRMDESFVMDLDDTIFRLYTNTFNNLGPFVVGMVGGFILLRASHTPGCRAKKGSLSSKGLHPSNKHESPRECHLESTSKGYLAKLGRSIVDLAMLSVVATIAVLVLSSVFYEQYTRFWAAFYWSSHRVGWAIVTGYMIHQCATGRWRLLRDFASLSTFVPLSKLIFIAFLVYPMFIYIHSGLVRDGLHVSIYNMLNIYITRLAMTFVTAMLIHLLVELPFTSIERIYLKSWVCWINGSSQPTIDTVEVNSKKMPLLALAPLQLGVGETSKRPHKLNTEIPQEM